MKQSEPCQNQDLETMSEPISSGRVITYRLAWHLRRDGLLTTMRRIVGLIFSRAGGLLSTKNKPIPNVSPAKAAPKTTGKALPRIEQSLNLQPGDWVEIRSKEEILDTLDEQGRFRGLYFMPGMAVHCGKRLRVYKRLERMILEATGELRDVKNTVLLEGAMCPGVGMRCDRSCFYFWREAWLKRAEPGTEAIPQLGSVSAHAATISIEEYKPPR